MPNGESLHQVTERVIRAFKTIVAANQGKRAVMVTHDAAVRVTVAHVLGVPNSIYRQFEINNASLTVVRINDGEPRLITLNDTAHFNALGNSTLSQHQ